MVLKVSVAKFCMEEESRVAATCRISCLKIRKIFGNLHVAHLGDKKICCVKEGFPLYRGSKEKTYPHFEEIKLNLAKSLRPPKLVKYLGTAKVK